MKKTDRILILGSTGLVGSSLLRKFSREGFTNILSPKRQELDLSLQSDVLKYFELHRPEYVVIAAAKVGGILANDTFRADFILENLTLQQNVFNAALAVKTPNLLFLGSSCIYPGKAPQPIHESDLLTSALEPTNEPYAIAKIAGLKVVENVRRQHKLDWISLMPANIYGPYDHFDPTNSHVIPGLIARMSQAIEDKQNTFSVWGSGQPTREFLFVDDLADACFTVMNYENKKNLPFFLNAGSGVSITIKDLASLIAEKLGYKGKIVFDTSKPDGTMEKVMDHGKISSIGWKPVTPFSEGLSRTVEFFKNRKITP